MTRRLRIAIVGSRGVPATHGGIERHVEEVGARLADRGHSVTVFCRPGYGDTEASRYRGMTLVQRPALTSKHLEAISHSISSALTTVGQGFDIVHFHAVGPALASPIPRYLSRAKVVQTVHGLDADRAKWSRPARTALRAGTWMSARVPDAVIGVSQALADHYRTTYGRTIQVIPNGVTAPPFPPGIRSLGPLGLEPGRYVLFVGRLVPEKAPHRLIAAFRSVVDPGLRLVVAGGSSFTDDYVSRLVEAAAADPRVVMPGFVYGEELAELYAHARLFVQPSDLEGLPLTLLEAAAHGAPVLASDIAPHREVVGIAGPGRRLTRSGEEAALADAIRQSLADPAGEARGAGAFREDVLARFSWDQNAEQTEQIYLRVVGRQ